MTLELSKTVILIVLTGYLFSTGYAATWWLISDPQMHDRQAINSAATFFGLLSV